jgi:hypothetical protein
VSYEKLTSREVLILPELAVCSEGANDLGMGVNTGHKISLFIKLSLLSV